MITNITARSFWDAENHLQKRRFREKENRIRKEVEKQLHEQLKSVKTGAMRHVEVKAVVKVNSMLFPRDYEKKLNKRGFVAIPYGEYDSNNNTQTFYVVLKGSESQYPNFSQFSFGE